MFFFCRHGTDDADVGIAPQGVLEQVSQFGVSVWHMRSGISMVAMITYLFFSVSLLITSRSANKLISAEPTIYLPLVDVLALTASLQVRHSFL